MTAPSLVSMSTQVSRLDPDSYVRTAVFYSATPRSIRSWWEESVGPWDGDFCRHEHDCCGHVYPSRAVCKRLWGGAYAVVQTLHRNV